MGVGEFYAWVEQAHRETEPVRADDPGTFRGTDQDDWWMEARRKRDELKQR